MGLQVPLRARAGVPLLPEDPGTDVTLRVAVTLLPHVDHGLVQPAVDGPVLSSLR